MDTYILQKDYEDPTGAIRRGTKKTIPEWCVIFPDMWGEDFDVKTDWFKKEEPKQWWQKVGVKFDGKWYTHPATNTYDNLAQVLVELREYLKYEPHCKNYSDIPVTNLKDKPKEELLPIKVLSLINSHFHHDTNGYTFFTSKEIPSEKYELIKKTIEHILNDNSNQIYEGLWSREAYQRLFEINQQILEQWDERMFTEKDLLDAEEKAFYAGRESNGFAHTKYKNFSDYKNN